MVLDDTAVSSGPRRVSDGPVMQAFSDCAADLQLHQLFLRPSGSCSIYHLSDGTRAFQRELVQLLGQERPCDAFGTSLPQHKQRMRLPIPLKCQQHALCERWPVSTSIF